MCIEFRKLNRDTKKVHKPPPLMEQVLERLSNNSYYFSLMVIEGIPKFLSNLKTKRK
jgi:hypothetical protein